MATDHSSTDFAADASESKGAREHGPFDTRQVIDLLFHKAAGSLSTSELKYLTGASDRATELAERASVVAEGIGCLVASDRSSGDFQDEHDVPQLMFHFAEVFRHVEGLVSLSGWAHEALSARQSEHV